MGEQKESRDEASSSLDPGSEDVKRSRRVAREQAGWVQKAAAAVGVAFLVAGVAGFVPGITTNLDGLELAGHESGAELLGVFQVSILHNVVHLIFGVVGLSHGAERIGCDALPHLRRGALLCSGSTAW